MYRCGVVCQSPCCFTHTGPFFTRTHTHTLHHFVGPARKSLLTCGVAADMWLERECVCNVAVEVPNGGGDDDEEKTIGNFLFLLVFFLFFFSRFISISYSQPSRTPDFYGLKGKKKYVYVYRNRVYLIFHDTNNPIIMTSLFSILTRYCSFSSSSPP